jgi:hypothetical protein
LTRPQAQKDGLGCGQESGFGVEVGAGVECGADVVGCDAFLFCPTIRHENPVPSMPSLDLNL